MTRTSTLLRRHQHLIGCRSREAVWGTDISSLLILPCNNSWKLGTLFKVRRARFNMNKCWERGQAVLI